MNQEKQICLVWQEKNRNARVFLIPEGSLTKGDKEMLVSLANRFFAEDTSDEDCDKLWHVKAAVSSSDIYVPKAVPKSWRGKFLMYECVIGKLSGWNISQFILIGKTVN